MVGPPTAQGTVRLPASPPLLGGGSTPPAALESAKSSLLLGQVPVCRASQAAADSPGEALQVWIDPPRWPGSLGHGFGPLFPCIHQFNKSQLLRLWDSRRAVPRRWTCPYRRAVTLETGTYEMASIMSMPISTQQWAWSALASGSPETQ